MPDGSRGGGGKWTESSALRLHLAKLLKITFRMVLCDMAHLRLRSLLSWLFTPQPPLPAVTAVPVMANPVFDGETLDNTGQSSRCCGKGENWGNYVTFDRGEFSRCREKSRSSRAVLTSRHGMREPGHFKASHWSTDRERLVSGLTVPGWALGKQQAGSCGADNVLKHS